MTLLEQLKRRCPWPVVNHYDPFGNPGAANPGTKRVHIVWAIFPRLWHEEIVAHESWHARLFDKGVQLHPIHNHIRHEIEADVYSLHILLKHRCKAKLQSAMACTRLARAGKAGRLEHQVAAYFVMDSNLWKRCEQYVRSKR